MCDETRSRTPSQSRRRIRSPCNRLQWNCSPRMTFWCRPHYSCVQRRRWCEILLPVLPLGEHPSGRGVVKYMEKNPARLPYWGIAVDTRRTSSGLRGSAANGRVAYDQTGGGVYRPCEVLQKMGTKLLEWAEDLARRHNAEVLTLENGNPEKAV